MRRPVQVTIQIFTILSFFAFLAIAAASSPGMVEGPPGCSWYATVTVASPANLAVELQTVHGTCMASPGDCGQSGDTLTVSVTDQAQQSSAGETVKVWVNHAADGTLQGTLTHPPCQRRPMSE